MKLILVVLLLIAQPVLTSARPVEIIIIRHGEKPEDRSSKHLSTVGEKRAKEFVPFLKSDPDLMKHGFPAALYATRPMENGRGQRPGETLRPLAKDTGLVIQTPYESDRPEDLAKLVLSNPDIDKKTVLICWTHEFIPRLIAAFGVRPAPAKLDEETYDRVYLITYDNGKALLREIRQSMPSPASKGKRN